MKKDKYQNWRDFIEDNFEELTQISKKICKKQDFEDIRNEMCLCLLSSQNISINAIENPIYYFSTMVSLSAYSKTSGYQRKYNKILISSNDIEKEFDRIEEPEPEQYPDSLIEEIENFIDTELFWYDREIFKLYVYGDISYRKLTEKLGIPKSSLHLTIYEVRKKILEHLKNKKLI